MPEIMQGISIRPLPLAGLFLCSLLLTSCDWLPGQTEHQDKSLDFENIEQAKRLDVPEAQTVAFKTETAWEDFWNAHVDATDASNDASPPHVDFDSRMVIGVFWGTTSGCTGFVDAVENVREEDGKVVVRIEEWSPGIQCQAIVQPRQVIQTEKRKQPVEFKGHVPD